MIQLSGDGFKKKTDGTQCGWLFQKHLRFVLNLSTAVAKKDAQVDASVLEQI